MTRKTDTTVRAAATGTVRAAATGTRKRGPAVALPASIPSADAAEWPGSARGRGRVNSPLREQLKSEVAEMEKGSVRRYEISDEAQQKSFLSLFRKVVDDVHGGKFGVQSVAQNGSLFVKLGDRRKVNK